MIVILRSITISLNICLLVLLVRVSSHLNLGPFVTRDEAAWGGDYHLNYNYQAPYWASFSSNHISLTDNFDQPLLDYMEAGRKQRRSC